MTIRQSRRCDIDFRRAIKGHSIDGYKVRKPFCNAGGHTVLHLHDAIKSIVFEVHLWTHKKNLALSYVGMAAISCFAGTTAKSIQTGAGRAATLTLGHT